MSRRKEYTTIFKRQVVLEVLSGKITKEGARLRYGIGGNSTILDWMRVYAGYRTKQAGIDPLPNLRNMQTNGEKTNLELREEVKQLRSELEYANLKARAYQIMVEEAKEQFDLDLEKKSGAKQSKDSKKNIRK